jgi:hypothetical protein
VTTYLVTLRDHETQAVVGYYDGAWTTDRRRALTLRRREAAEAHAARMRDCCPRNADVIKGRDRCRRPALTASVETPDAGGTRSEARVAVGVEVTAGQVTMSGVVPTTNTRGLAVDPTLDPNAPGAEGRRRENGCLRPRNPRR